jgi:uncharacterized coiled-coil protein SlyX
MSSLIGEEIRSQDEIIDGLDGDMGGARATLANMMKHMDRLIAQVSPHRPHRSTCSATCPPHGAACVSACSRGAGTCAG